MYKRQVINGFCLAVFRGGAGRHLTAESIRHQLTAVADAQDRVFATDFRQVDFESLLVVDRERAAGKDNADDRRVVFRHFVVGYDFAVHVKLADASSDELCGLRTEIQNDYFFVDK